MDNQSIIAKMDDRSIERLICLMPANEIDIVKTPETGLLMMAVKDSFDVEFYLGEILVTEAEVRYNGKKGYSMVMGDEPERAIAAAVVDAVLGSDNKKLKMTVNRVLASCMKRVNKNEKQQGKLTARTKVSFETMRKG
ncbi:MAG: phosphonate C-P lyase system protein PhnG [Nitrospirae bacterium]|nr:phosphonate C-P lyase system protein PhnG [Nitrospirota bacterium]